MFPAVGRQLRATVSDASTAASATDTSFQILDSWCRLADAKLARSRLESLRELAAAPASASAMVGRTLGYGDTIDEEIFDDDASIATTVPFQWEAEERKEVTIDGKVEIDALQRKFKDFALTISQFQVMQESIIDSGRCTAENAVPVSVELLGEQMLDEKAQAIRRFGEAAQRAQAIISSRREIFEGRGH